MSEKRRAWIVLLVALGLLTAAGVASADDNTAADDTLLNIGYDEANHVLIVNSSATDSAFDCTLENGPLAVGYESDDTGPVAVKTLEVEVEPEIFEAFQFLNRPEDEVDTEEFTLAEEPAKYTGPDGECGLSAGQVGGPNGQINHGQFMKLFHQLIDGQGMGCLNRVMAQSNFGKDDQKIRTSEVDDAFAPEATGTVGFETFAVDCKRDKHDKGEDHPGGGNNKADKADRPGNSGNARGHNK